MRQELIRILRFKAFRDIQIDPEPLVSEEAGPAADAVPSEKPENIGSSTRSCAFFYGQCKLYIPRTVSILSLTAVA